MTLPARIPRKPKRATRWRSRAHTRHVRGYACAMCGSTTNVVAAHVKMGAHTGTAQKGDDWLTAPLCEGPYSNADGQLGCHDRQHIIGEVTFWNQYEQRHGQTVWRLLDELCAGSPKRREIAELKRERENGS